MEQRVHKRFDAYVPVVTIVQGSTYPNCLISNCSVSGLFLVFEPGCGDKVISTESLNELIGEEITVNIPVKPGSDTPFYATVFSVIRASEAGLGIAYSDSTPHRIVLPTVTS